MSATEHIAPVPSQPQDGEPLLAVSHVTLVYEMSKEDAAPALDDVSLELHAGERVCVLGANGSGKTTLASVLCGLLAPDEGSVSLLGENACVDGTVDLEAYRRARRGIGLVFQNPEDQIVTSVVTDDIAFGPENLGVAPDEIARRVQRELCRVALEDYALADPRRLSGGQQQRVAIASALAMESRAVVFDEPGALLDVRGRRSILHVMNRLCTAGVGVVHITHYMEEALGADRVVVLNRGRVVLSGTPQEVFSSENDLTTLGLEQPFASQLSGSLAKRGLPVRWTCDEVNLMGQLAELAHATSPQTPRTRPSATTQDGPATQAQAAGVDASTSLLSFSHVSFSYQGAAGDLGRALDDVSLAIHPGESVAIVGQTGSGKSTLLRLMCALEVPDAGEVLIGGHSTKGGGRGRKARAWRARLRTQVGFVMQRPERQLFANTVEEDVAFGPTNQGLSPDEVRARVEMALDLCGIRSVRDRSPFELSGGQQRLCAIAGILAMQPPTLVLDEPTAGLDPKGRSELRTLLADLHAHGVTIVQVTHSMEDAAHAQRVIVLDQAHILATGSPQEVFAEEMDETLALHGLGMPRPLRWARRLETAGVIAPGLLGEPLSTEALVDGLADLLGAGGQGGDAHGV